MFHIFILDSYNYRLYLWVITVIRVLYIVIRVSYIHTRVRSEIISGRKIIWDTMYSKVD